MLVYVYPLKAIHSDAIEFFSAGYFPSYFEVESIEDLRAMFIIFGVGYAALAGIIALLNQHALRHGERLGLSELECYDTISTRLQWTIHVAVPCVSIILALTMSGTLIVLAGLAYGSFDVLSPLLARRRRRGCPAEIAEG